MTISRITDELEILAPLSLQENYDNAGLLTGNKDQECIGILVCLDVSEEIISEAVEKKCNLIVAHHPIIFKGLKKINGKNYVERIVISAIKNDMAIYAVHTNLDNVIKGVNGKIADKLVLINRSILAPKENLLQKLAVFVPVNEKEKVLNALFASGAGHIGNYSECSFSTAGTGTYMAGENATPHLGKIGERHNESEIKIEVVFPSWLQQQVINAMLAIHPYEEVAYDLYNLSNNYLQTGSGLAGELEKPMTETDFLQMLKQKFKISCIRHTCFTGRLIKKVALCGGAGSFLIAAAKSAAADVYVSADIKYHEFFEADGQMLLADIGHYESEQFTTDLLFDFLKKKFLNFAVLKTVINTNPVNYYQ